MHNEGWTSFCLILNSTLLCLSPSIFLVTYFISSFSWEAIFSRREGSSCFLLSYAIIHYSVHLALVGCPFYFHCLSDAIECLQGKGGGTLVFQTVAEVSHAIKFACYRSVEIYFCTLHEISCVQ